MNFIILIIIIQYLKIIISINTINFNLNLNNFLFDSIKGDDFNFTFIFNFNYTTIKIKKYSSSKKKSLICVLGILVNNNGLEIEKELTDWLKNEYIIYKVYQKFPGKLFEYPALKFAQWLTEYKNISFVLYLHTKGASHKNIADGTKLLNIMLKYANFLSFEYSVLFF